MMQINRENYEAFFIDYLEGNLDEKVVDDFIAFIKLNPDLKKELELFESVEVVPESFAYAKKDSLYKEKYDSETAFNNAAIARMEGDISQQEDLEFETYLEEHPDKKADAALFAHTRLIADESIRFNKKNKLFRRSAGKIILLWSGSAAAILILALAIFTFMDNTSPQMPLDNELAIREDIKDKEENTEPSKQDPENTGQKKITPAENKKTELDKPKKLSPKPEKKKLNPEKKNNKSIRETTKGRLEEHDDLVVERIPLEVPDELRAIAASLEVRPTQASMATMYISYPDEYYEEERLLGDQVKEKINLRKISKAGLDLFANISNERFTYETNKEGMVTEYKYDSRLLAFSLPGRKTQPE